MWAKIKQIIDKVQDYVLKIWGKHKLSLTLTALIMLLLVSFFWQNMFVSVPSGHYGVFWNRFSGTDIGQVFNEGLHFIFPWDRVYIYDGRLQNVNDSVRILTEDGLAVNVEFSYRFSPQPDSIPALHKRIGIEYASKYIEPEVRAATMGIIGNYTPEKLYKLSSFMIQSIIRNYLVKKLNAQNILLDAYLIKRITLPKLVTEAIDRKMAAEQLSKEFDYKISIEEKEQKRKIIEAEGIRQFEAISKIPILKWRGLEVTNELSKSPNSKIIIMGNGANNLPVLLNGDGK